MWCLLIKSWFLLLFCWQNKQFLQNLLQIFFKFSKNIYSDCWGKWTANTMEKKLENPLVFHSTLPSTLLKGQVSRIIQSFLISYIVSGTVGKLSGKLTSVGPAGNNGEAKQKLNTRVLLQLLLGWGVDSESWLVC